MIAIAPTFASLLVDSFDQIRRNAAGNVDIMARMLGALQTIASLTTSPRRRRRCANKCSRLPSWQIALLSPRVIACASKSG